ncbi:MAG: PD40 domain-containing protein [Bacteroidales bacterium]|nr:PD40 domain-containing protein [Bacteroidales bacterium]
MRRLVHLLLLVCLPLMAMGQGCGVKQGDKAAYEKAVACYGKHQYREAAQQLRRLAGRNPKSADVQFWLGMTAVKDGFNTAAIRRYFTRCIELDPDYPDALAHYYMGLVHYTDDRFDEAVAELDRYFQLSNGTDNAAWMAVYEEASNYLYWSRFLAEAMLNMAPFDPRRVEGVSSRQNELLPYLSPDGQTFYYLREVPVSSERTFYSRELEQKQWRLYSSKRLGDTAFSKGVELPPPFNSGDPEGMVSLTADGSELYYSVIRNSGGYANSDIYRVRCVEGVWQEPEPLGPQVNGDRTWESQPSVSADGRTLIFASNRKGGAGGIDLWRCHRLKNGDWSRAENLGTNINTAGNEKAPFLAADGRTLYFLSDGWQGFGGYDVYFSDLADPYGNRPTNLGLPINGEDDAVSFGVTADGRQAYYAAKPEDARSSDVFLFDLYPAARPEPMRLCRIHLASEHRDTVLMLSEQYTAAVLIDGPLPVILCGKARDLDGRTVRQADSLTAIALSEPALDALKEWLVEHPRVHIVVESPKAADAQAAVDSLRQKGIRAERLTARGGTDIKQSQIRLQ